jgi:hypothetical protein
MTGKENVKQEWQVPFRKNSDIELKWQLGRLFAVNKNYPAERIQLTLDTGLRQQNETWQWELDCQDQSKASVTINLNFSVATLTLHGNEKENNSKGPGDSGNKAAPKTYVNSTPVLNWNANQTTLEWGQKGLLYVVEQDGGEKIELDLSKAQIHKKQYLFDMKTADNQLIRVIISRNQHWARLLTYDSLDFPVDQNGFAVIPQETQYATVRKFTHPVVAKLQGNNWIETTGELQWRPGNNLFVVEGTPAKLNGWRRNRNRRIHLDLSTLKPDEQSIIHVTLNNQTMVLEIAADRSSASLRRFNKPDAWAGDPWQTSPSYDSSTGKWHLSKGRAKTYYNGVHDYVTELAGIDLGWVAETGVLQWQPNDSLFLVDSSPGQNRRINIDNLIKPGKPDTIKIFSGNHRVLLKVEADRSSAHLEKLDKPASWSDDLWSDEKNRVQTWKNKVRDYVTELAGIDLGWVANYGSLQWAPKNRLFLVNNDPNVNNKDHNQRVEIIPSMTKSGVIKIFSDNHRVLLTVKTDNSSATLKRLDKPEGWKTYVWADEKNRVQTRENNVRDYVTGNNNRLDNSSSNLSHDPQNHLMTPGIDKKPVNAPLGRNRFTIIPLPHSPELGQQKQRHKIPQSGQQQTNHLAEQTAAFSATSGATPAADSSLPWSMSIADITALSLDYSI